MSVHDVFAAQMWSWPDPLLKRDAQGQVLFVNEAFLRLYGGQAQDWHGNAVGGWPAPQGGHAPYRFETRAPNATADGQALPERVYDWIEHGMMDGTALCIGRDVTDIITPTPNGGIPAPVDAPPPAAADEPTTSAAPQAEAPSEPAQPLQAPPEHAPAAEAPQNVENPAPAAHVETPATAAPEIPQAPAVAATPEQAPQDAALEEAPAAVTVAAAAAAAMVAHNQLQPTEQQNAAPDMAEPEPVAEAEPVAEPDPIAERGPLPIEDSNNVLGNNWRDAVIAKAVGATAPEPAKTESKPTPAATSGANSGPHRILLAEDNAINALLTRTLLEAEGCVVDVVEDGQLAVEAMKTTSYDMIFMDMRMPNMDGLESTRKIRTLPNVPAGLPIVALTANAFDDDRNACFDSGMNDFMTKPVSAEELAQMVERWAGKDANMKEAS